MDSFELNKIAGSLLAALLIIFGGRELVQITSSGSGPAAPGYVLPAPQVASAGASAATTAPVAAFSFAKVAPLLQKANVGNGQAAFKKCATCHSPDKGGKNGTGPNLWSIVGRDIGTVPGFTYSEPLKAKPGDWSFEALAGYIHDPKGYIPGNKMAFSGVKDDAELADVLAYLRSLSDSPVPLPQ